MREDPEGLKRLRSPPRGATIGAMTVTLPTSAFRAALVIAAATFFLGACQDSRNPPSAVGGEGKAPVEVSEPAPATPEAGNAPAPDSAAAPSTASAAASTDALAAVSPSDEKPMKTEDPSPAPTPTTEVITLGGGCFWCTEAVVQRLEGVVKVVSGYMGGHVENPTYEQICTKTTGHAEVIQVTFDPGKITLDEILDVFWQAHDPTTLNRQGADVGPQYRSAIFYHTPEQRNIASLSMKRLDESGAYPDPAVTEITEASTFWPAEDYHQNYYELNKDKNPYCRVVISPKLKKLGME
jgi:peptide-methionine (S)-S-oxide reductase